MFKFFGVQYALKGLYVAWKEESNFRFQVCFAVLVVVFGFALNISLLEWGLIIFMIGFVLTVELFNTALEELCDKFTREHDPHIAKIKDLSAAAVLAASSTALIVGLVIFIPHLRIFFGI